MGLVLAGLAPSRTCTTRGSRLIHGVTGKSVNRQAGRMAEEAAEGHLLLLGELVLRHFPGDEFSVYVFIQSELALFHQPQCSQSRHRLADRTGLKERRAVTGVCPPCSVVP